MRLYKNQLFVSSLFLLSILCACAQRNVYAHETHLSELPVDTVSVNVSILGTPKNGIINISDTIDLNHRACTIPAGIILNFKGGVIKNGTLVGNMTQVKSSRTCFSRLRIQGTWNVPVIKSSYFCDLNYDNSLKDVMALSNPAVKNTVIIDEGVYHVTAMENSDACIPLCSNTDVILYGKIILTPNAYTNYYIIKIQGDNINLRGNATLEGDKHTHLGKVGEWGMGINIDHSNNVTVSGLTIKDCWGDCIYVGGESEDIIIEKCSLDHGRRQGISITSAKRVTIKDCSISNVAGTLPEYAIDIEPNKGNDINKVVIDNVNVSNCKGGVMANGRAEGAYVGTVIIKNCNIQADNRPAVNLGKCRKVKVLKCTIIQQSTPRGINCEEINDLVIKGNNIQQNYLGNTPGIKTIVKQFGKDRLNPIRTDQCDSMRIRNNICMY